MKYSKLIRGRMTDIIFIALIAISFFIYFVIYMTPSRIAWYREMRNQMVIIYHILMDMRR
jgi:hypothetical protein